MSSSLERPAKRIRQACEPCRRKKSRCPGEKPICSYCSRLGQSCMYAEERNENERAALRSVSPPPQTPQGRSRMVVNDIRIEDRLKNVESQLAEVLANQNSATRASSAQVLESPANVHRTRAISNLNIHDRLPSWDIMESVAEAYILYCDCQPLPLFHRSSFVQSLKHRNPEVLFSLLALGLRFTNEHVHDVQAGLVNDYVETARTIILKKCFDGTVELSTIQALCLLTLVDFTDGNTRRASIHSSLAMGLAHNAGLTSEAHKLISSQGREERRRCFWSLFLLKRLHGADFIALDFSTEDNFPWYPKTTGKPLSPEELIEGQNNDTSTDKGIVAYSIQLSEVWFKITRYAWRRGVPNNLPPWSPQSEYTTILAQQMDFETRMPYTHRFKPAKFSQRSIEELIASRDYWGPWLFIQFLYHTNLCLLNHPLLISLRLRNFKGVIPEIFLQHTSDLISSHASWIINLIDMLEAKQFKVTDPFLAHCVAVIATIYLQESYSDDLSKRQEKQNCFEKCLQFIHKFINEWPHVGRIAKKLHNLRETVSSTHVASDEPIRQSRKLLIDLAQFFEILEYSSSSEIPSLAKDLFGPSLFQAYSERRTEMAETTVLPEPTRVEGQEFGTPMTGTPIEGISMVEREGGGILPFGAGGNNAPPLQFSDDELAVLAENFFQQRPEVDGGANWWNLGNL